MFNVYVSRDIKENFDKISQSYNMIALVGARQSGKTTFLMQHMKELKSSYILFDDPDAGMLFEEDIKKFEMQYLEGYELSVLGEVQYCRDAGRKLKYLVDMGRKLWITSSSEIILGKEVLSYLVGRVSIVRFHPFNYQEFLNAKGQKAQTPGINERMIWEHLTYGGYPKVVLTKDPEMKRTILKDLYEMMILKDVAMNFSIDNIRALENCARYLAVTTGSLISYEQVTSELGVSFQTLRKYIDALEKSYLITTVRPFFTNLKKEISKQPRVYFLVTGLRNAVAHGFGPEPDGNLFENFVFTELIKMGLSPKYWRSKAKAEVDFVIDTDEGVIPIEVKLRTKPGRIERSLRAFIRAYSPQKALVVGYKVMGGDMKVDDCRITFTDVGGLRDDLSG